MIPVFATHYCLLLRVVSCYQIAKCVVCLFGLHLLCSSGQYMQLEIQCLFLFWGQLIYHLLRSCLIMYLEANKNKIVGWLLQKLCKNYLLAMLSQKRGGDKMRFQDFKVFLHLVFCGFFSFGFSMFITVLSLFFFHEQPMALPPSVYQRLTSSPTLMNLAQALAYHKMWVGLSSYMPSPHM